MATAQKTQKKAAQPQRQQPQQPAQDKPKPKLTFVKPSEDVNANVLLYGAPKVGKTVGAASAPKPLLYLNADRPNATRFAHSLYDFDEARIESLTTLIAAMHELDKGKYKSVVLDPISDVYRIVLEGLSGKALSPQIQQYGDTGTHLERFCRSLCEKPVNAIFVAHETAVKDEESGHFERLPYTGTNNPVFGHKLMSMVDVIGYTGIVTSENADEAPRYIAQLLSGKGRRGGDRFGALGVTREINLTEWVEVAREAVKTQPEKGERSS